jgi:acyl carrier protein
MESDIILSHADSKLSINRTNMDREEIKNRVKKVTAKVLEIDESEILDNSNFSFDLGASSMQSILLVSGYQEEFNIEMDEQKSLEIQTISEAADFISTYVS